MVHPLVLLAGAYLVAEGYKKFTTPEEKHDWESKVKTHHGEVGLLAGVLGALTGNYGVAAAGLGLALHDIDDAKKWFTGDKQAMY